MSAVPQHAWTPEAYLKYERSHEQRHEYVDGTVFAMAGASEKHNLILANALSSLHAQLRKRDCTIYPSDLRLKVSATGMYTYPDISVVCGTAQFEDEKRDTLLNPIVIVEVLSPSTERYDRGKKFQHYRALESLKEYVLIAQDGYRIEHYSRQSDGQWLFSDVDNLAGVVELSTIHCTLQAADVYEKVLFEKDTTSPTDEAL